MSRSRVRWWVAGGALVLVGCLMPLMRFSGLYATQRPFSFWVLASGAAIAGAAAWVAYDGGRQALAVTTAGLALVIATGAPSWAPEMVSMLVFITLVALGVFRYFPDDVQQTAEPGTGAPPN